MIPTRALRGVRPAVFLVCSTLLTAAQERAPDATPMHGERLAPEAIGPGRVIDPRALPSADADPARAMHAYSRASSASPTAPADAANAPGALVFPPPAPPLTGMQFAGPALFDAGNTAIPPDPGIAAGPEHLVTVVNRNVSVWVKGTGARLVDVTLASFFGAPATPSLGNPRVVWDPNARRFFVSASDLTTRIWLAVSTSENPLSGWFTTSFVASQGVDAGLFPDYPLLAVDGAGVYVTARMYPGAPDHSALFAIDKAPLLAAQPALGTVTAFRGLNLEIALQPCQSFGSTGGQHFVAHVQNTAQLRMHRLQGPLTAPTLVDAGTVTVPAMTSPFTVPALGSTTPLMIGLTALDGAVQHRGRIWTWQHVTTGSTTSIRWYELDPVARTLVSTGTISDPQRFYYDAGLAVNARGDLVFVFNGSSATELASVWISARLAADPAGTFAPPALLKAGESTYNVLDGIGRNRWGNHNTVVFDADDPHVFWSGSTYSKLTNRWGTWIAKHEFGAPGEALCAGDGLDLAVVAPCPCGNFGARGHGCANSVEPDGALLASRGALGTNDVTLLATGMPAGTMAVFFAGDAMETGGAPFGDGVRCAGGVLLRMKLATSQAGAAQFPDAGDPALSAASGVTVGSGAFRWYQAAYRNTAAAFCPPATLNATNAQRVLW